MHRIFSFLTIFLVSILAPLTTQAHTRWFAEPDTATAAVHEPTGLYLAYLGLAAFILTVIGVLLQRAGCMRLTIFHPNAPHAFERAASTFTMVSGAFFLIAGTHEYLFSPNLDTSAGIPAALIVLQVVIGLAFLLGIASRVCGVALGLLYSTLFFYVGTTAALENLWVLATAIFITIMGNQYFALISFSFLRDKLIPLKPYALSLLRIGVGLNLIILGLSEKILSPELGLSFLEQHQWNFMQHLGIPYSDYLFTLSAGMVEFLFGLIFVLGVVTRLNSLVLLIVFLIPMFILGPIELTGHLPYLAAVTLLLLFGSGQRLTFPSQQPHM